MWTLPYLKVKQFEMHTDNPLGDLIFMKLSSNAYLTTQNEWFCDKISVTTPEGAKVSFPCYRWLHPHKKMYITPATGTGDRLSSLSALC